MKKRFVPFLLIAAALSASAYAGDVIVKDLRETVIFRRDDPRFNQAGLAADAEAYIDFFREARREKISRLLSLYRPDSIRAVLEWGGGLEKRYCVVMFTDDSLCWLTWVKDDEACGKVVIDNDKLRESIQRKIERLSRYDGGEERWIVCDRTVLFMTFYYNQLPFKTFCSDFPGRAQISAPGFPGELDDLIQTAGKMIGGTENVEGVFIPWGCIKLFFARKHRSFGVYYNAARLRLYINHSIRHAGESDNRNEQQTSERDDDTAERLYA